MGNETYRPRIADKLLSEKLDAMGAVLIEGAKWCGKTTTAEQAAKRAAKEAAEPYHVNIKSEVKIKK